MVDAKVSMSLHWLSLQMRQAVCWTIHGYHNIYECSQKAEGSFCPSAPCWEGCTWNTAFSFELPVQKLCGENGERPVKKTKMAKAWGTRSARRCKGRRAALAWRWWEACTSSAGWKETEQRLQTAYKILKGCYKDDRAKLFSPDNVARVNKHELELRRFGLDIRKHSVSRRVTQPWSKCQDCLYPSVFTGFSCTKTWLSWSNPGPGKSELETSKNLFPPGLLWFLWFNFFESCFPMEVHSSSGCYSFMKKIFPYTPYKVSALLEIPAKILVVQPEFLFNNKGPPVFLAFQGFDLGPALFQSCSTAATPHETVPGCFHNCSEQKYLCRR